MIGTAEEALLRRAIALAAESRAGGHAPFGAVIAAPDGTVLAEGQNRVHASRDPTAHAEIEAIRAAAKAHGPAALAGATLYASTEPCAMCAAAAYIAGIGRVVFGLREAEMAAARGAPLPFQPVQLPCAELAARGRRRMEVFGPALESEARAVHAGYREPAPR
ncbi:MAG: nucleoside deaminase [Acetobacteraceae bacterium]|nr:nucleoside deaminase [Acetobacteraceae bacterium]